MVDRSASKKDYPLRMIAAPDRSSMPGQSDDKNEFATGFGRSNAIPAHAANRLIGWGLITMSGAIAPTTLTKHG
jgi:hypothetical protein